MSQRVVFGAGAIRRVPRLLEAYDVRRVFLVTGHQSFDASGAARQLHALLGRFEVTGRFCQFSENPKLEEVERGTATFRSAAADAIVAVGGGSVLDMAKLVNVLARQQGAPEDIVLGHAAVSARGVPLIAVPTTAGSGSEATHFAVVYIGKSKYSVAAAPLLPDVAVIDPGLSASVPPKLAAVTGMDAFAQAVESYWSVHSTAVSKCYARRAIGLVLRHLPTAVNAPTPAARRGMSKAAHFAGRAINITKTTGAHAMSYPLTSYFGIPHGHAVCLTLGRWLLFNSAVTDEDVTDSRGAAYVRQTVAELGHMMGAHDAEEACRIIESLTSRIGLQTRLASLGVSRSAALEVVLPNVNIERVVNNPRALTDLSLRQLVEAVC